MITILTPAGYTPVIWISEDDEYAETESGEFWACDERVWRPVASRVVIEAIRWFRGVEQSRLRRAS